MNRGFLQVGAVVRLSNHTSHVYEAPAWFASIVVETLHILSATSYLSQSLLTASAPVNYGMVVFPGFQALDVFGPLDALNVLSLSQHMNLAIIAGSLDPVSTKPLSAAMNAANSSFGESIVPTHTFSDPPKNLEVLFIPGGFGTRAPDDDLAPIFDYIKTTYPGLKYLITVCTGATLAARSGVLNGKSATTNKKAWKWATGTGPKTNWVAHARWVVDGNIYTSSGISAGIDATIAFIGSVYGDDVAQAVADSLEHVRVKDPADDPFAVLNNCSNVPPKQ